MKPHPRIRKTIKWGGAAVTVLLVVVWALSVWYRFYWWRPSGLQVFVERGGVGVVFSPVPARIQMHGGWAIEGQPGGLSLHGWGWGRAGGGWYAGGSAWPLLLAGGIATALAWRLDTLARRRARLNLCPKCNYDRAGLAAGAKCPECGSLPA